MDDEREAAKGKQKAAATPMKVRTGTRRYGRTPSDGSSHLTLQADKITCRKCRSSTPRPAGATHLVVEHELDCPIVQERAA